MSDHLHLFQWWPMETMGPVNGVSRAIFLTDTGNMTVDVAPPSDLNVSLVQRTGDATMDDDHRWLPVESL